jgi:hypothetical protein
MTGDLWPLKSAEEAAIASPGTFNARKFKDFRGRGSEGNHRVIRTLFGLDGRKS